MKITFGINTAADCVTAIAALTVIRDGFDAEHDAVRARPVTETVGGATETDAVAASAEPTVLRHSPNSVTIVPNAGLGGAGVDADAGAPAEDVPAETDPRGGVELDANGTPWIESVHAGTKNKKKDGTWKKKVGVDEDVMKAAEVEARAKLAATPAPALPTSDGEPETVPVEELPPITIDQLSAVYSEAVEKGVVQTEQVTDLYIKHGCQEVGDIATNETARRGVHDELRAMIDAADAAPAGLPGM